MENITDRLKQIFEQSKESQASIAKKTNVSPAYIWKIINGNIVKPSNLFLNAVCREFKVNEDWLLNGIGEPYIKNIDWSDVLKKLENTNDYFLKNMIEIYLELDQESKEMLKTIVKKLNDKNI